MRRPVLVLGALSAIAMGGQGSQNHIVVEGDTFKVEGLGTLTIDGVCELSAEGASCWDISGKADTDLEDRIEKIYREEARVVQISFGKKTREVILSWEPAPKTPRGSMPVLYSSNTRQSQVRSLTKPDALGPIFGVVTMPLSADTKVFDLTFAVYQSKVSDDYTLTLKKGEKAIVGDSSMEVTKIERVPRERLVSGLVAMNAGKHGWRAYVTPKNVRMSNINMKTEFATKEGVPFTVVNDDGKPQPGAERKAGTRPFVGYNRNTRGNEEWFETNVQPDEMGPIKFAVQSLTHFPIKFQAVAAEPKKEQSR